VLEMLSQACDIDYTDTDSAVEAAVLETDEIKRHSPPYNIALKHGDREIGFSTRDFLNQWPKPDKTEILGPLPSPDALVPLALLNELTAAREAQTEDVSVALNIPGEYAPALSVFREGLTEFFQRYEAELRPNSAYRNFIRLGAMFWKKRMEAAAETILEAEDLIEEGIDEIEDEKWEWTPDAVTNAVEGVVRRCVHLIRRARWFCLVSESSLAWERGHKGKFYRNYLVIHKGKPVGKGVLKDGEDIPVPSGYQRSTLLRQQSFDVATYDRMRVVTTEIRRLLSEGREVELCLRPNTVLQNKSLKRFLLWI
jgi:DNA polymerase-3 subunit epsilon